MIIYIDADSCSVKNETFKVAARYKLKVIVVANQYLSLPQQINIEMKVVSKDFDAADDWIAGNITDKDILITSDLLLAERAIKAKASVVGQKGNELDEENIGSALAGRQLNTHLLLYGEKVGPKASGKADKSKFLGKLDQVIQRLKRKI